MPIRLEDIRKQYKGGTVAVDRLTLDIPAGELVVLVGPSGCGKSTILRMVNRLIEPTAGRIFLGDEDITHANPVGLRRRIGYVIQHVGLFPHQTIRTNVATVPRLLGWPRDQIEARTNEMLELVDLDPEMFGPRYPHELSGGQRQRVGVIRALAADPAVMLMDEPFSAVDPIVRNSLQAEFLRLQKAVGKTIVFVTHDVDEAVRLADRIAVLSEHGHLEQYDSPGTVLSQPANEFVAEFVGVDREVKRLGITPISLGELQPLPQGYESSRGNAADASSNAPPAIPLVDEKSSLRDALSVLLEGDTGWVAVQSGDGQIRGVLYPDTIYAALRSR